MATFRSYIIREMIVLDDEKSPSTSKYDVVYPVAVLDSVIDQDDEEKPTLRTILERLRNDIMEGGIGSIHFPVTSVKGQAGPVKYGNVVITKEDLGLSKVENIAPKDMPFSTPQYNAVMTLIQAIDPSAGLTDIFDHISNFNNPHKVSFADINVDSSVTNFVNSIVDVHSKDPAAHLDIRNLIDNLTLKITNVSSDVTTRITDIKSSLIAHLTDSDAHGPLFINKEDVINKVGVFSKLNNNNYISYPSTAAVVTYVEDMFKNYTPPVTITDYVKYLSVANDTSELPPLSADVYQHAYLLKRHGTPAYTALAVCRKDTSNNFYWDVRQIAINEFDQNLFIEGTNGITINMNHFVEPGDVYSKEEAEAKFLSSVHMRTGTMRGTVAIWVDNDITTLIDNVAVNGLGNLAYLNTISKDEIQYGAVKAEHIADGAIGGDHIVPGSIYEFHLTDNSVGNRHLQDWSVNGPKIVPQAITYEHMAGESIDSIQIRPNAVLGQHIAPLQIRTDHIINLNVTRAKLEFAAVGSDQLDSLSVGTNHIMSSAVTTAKIDDAAVTTIKIADSNVTTAKIANSNITNVKLANMPSKTIKVNDTASAAAPQDITYQGFVNQITLGRI